MAVVSPSSTFHTLNLPVFLVLQMAEVLDKISHLYRCSHISTCRHYIVRNTLLLQLSAFLKIETSPTTVKKTGESIMKPMSRFASKKQRTTDGNS